VSRAGGTDWTSPGRGASADELYRAVSSMGAPGEVGRYLAARCGLRVYSNVTLTGRALVQYDLDRIMSAEWAAQAVAR